MEADFNMAIIKWRWLLRWSASNLLMLLFLCLNVCLVPKCSFLYFSFDRVARTVIFGGLINSDMAEEVHCQAREIGTVCSINYPLSRKDLEQHGNCGFDLSSPWYIMQIIK